MFYLAIVGRPNVGKSTLFNKIVGGRPAIVDDRPGVTRDRNLEKANHGRKDFVVIDSGGFEPTAKEVMLRQMREQTLLAIEEASAIIFVTDGKTGRTPADEEIGRLLRKAKGKPVICAVNKLDSPKDSDLVYPFERLGFKTFGVSAEHSDGLYEAMDAILETCPDRKNLAEDGDEDEQTEKKLPPLRIAVVGKPNVGKSSLINRIIGKKRMMVSEVAGTTRDTIDSEVDIDGREYLLVDTAGIRKKAKVSDRVEIFSVIKAIKSLEKADLALLVISAIDGISMQEAKIAGEISKAGIACVIVVNKWDAVEKTDKSTLEFSEAIEQQLKFLSFAPIIFVSALSGQRVLKIFDVVEKVKEQYERRIETGRLNQMILDITKRKNPPVYRNKRLKFYYVTQTGVRPPTFVFMTNYPEGVDFSYKRYLINRLKESTGIDMAPVHLIFKRSADRRSKGGKKKSRVTG